MKRLILAAAAFTLTPAAFAAEITVTPSDEFAVELVEEYGERELGYLSKKIEYYLDKQLTKQGVDAARVEVIINDARPNKPTMKQLGDNIGLDFGRSISTGGMDLTGVAYDASGAVVAELSYDWYENDIRWAGPTTWYDARRAAERFSRKFVKELK